MKSKYAPTLLLLLCFSLIQMAFAQEDPPTMDLTCPSSCEPECIGQPFWERYWDPIYSSGWGPVTHVPYNLSPTDGVKTLDFYGYVDECQKRPLVVILPGSGFTDPTVNIKNAQTVVWTAEYFAKRGYAVAVVDYYRIAPPCNSQLALNTVVHKAAQDVHSALQYLVGNADELNIDPANIFVIGESAGGVAGLSALFSGLDGQLLMNELQPNGLASLDYSLNAKTLPEFKNVHYCVRAFAGISTAVPAEGVFDNRARHTDIPLMFIHGTIDKVVPYQLGLPDPANCSNGNLTIQFCGSGCMVDKIISDPQSTNCYKSHQIGTHVHALMAFPPIQGSYWLSMRNFFYETMWCAPCNSYRTPTPWPPGAFKTENSGMDLFPQTDSKVLLFPNPTDEQVTISNVAVGTQVILVNLLGETVLSTTIHQASSSIDVSRLKAGIYLVNITSNGVTTTEKLIVQ